MTHTFALLDLSPAAYVEIEGKLRAAGYEHAIDRDDGTIDMHGLGIAQPPRHSSGCSNQNVLHPLGAYTDAEECGCRSP